MNLIQMVPLEDDKTFKSHFHFLSFSFTKQTVATHGSIQYNAQSLPIHSSGVIKQYY